MCIPGRFEIGGQQTGLKDDARPTFRQILALDRDFSADMCVIHLLTTWRRGGNHPELHQPATKEPFVGLMDNAKDMASKATDAADKAKDVASEHADKLPGDMGDKVSGLADKAGEVTDKIPGASE